MREPRKAFVGAVAVGAVLIALAACSSDSSGGADTTVPGPSSTATNGTSEPTPTGSGAPDTTGAQPTGTPTADDIAMVEVAGDLERPVDMVWRDGDTDPFVVLQPGRVVRLHGRVVGDTVLEIGDEVSGDGEQGLLGLAFHPSDNSLACTFTTARDSALTVSEYTVADDGRFDTASRRLVLEIDHPNGNHNGGQLAFGPDGYLYIGTGDGGAANDPDRNSLDLGELLGKILRIDPRQDGDQPYTVPADNPFIDTDGARSEIWAYGLRNPWRFSFDPATGELWIGDVGQGQWEEVDLARADDGGGRGLNFGWSAYEGTHRFNDDQPDGGVTMPVYEYSHDDGGCSVTGGEVYRGDTVASLVGWYVFGDYCGGTLWALSTTDSETSVIELAGSLGSIAAIVAAPDGTL